MLNLHKNTPRTCVINSYANDPYVYVLKTDETNIHINQWLHIPFY